LARAYERFTKTVRMFSRLQILTFSAAAIDRYEVLRRSKLGVKGNDLRIAAIALENSAIIVTRNRVDFERVPGLAIEDWSRT
jgi:tRNA(fMet)-specific endonuclease VapC